MNGQSSNALSNRTVTEPVAAGQIESELVRGQALVANVHECLTQLEQRVAGVVITEPPSPTTANKPSEVASCPVHGMLLETNDTIQGAIRRINSLSERVRL